MMQQRPASTKKPSSAYTRCRAVDWKYNRRRNLRRDVEGIFFAYGNNDEVIKHLYQKKFLHKLKECPKCGNKINRQRVRSGRWLDYLRCKAKGGQHRFADLTDHPVFHSSANSMDVKSKCYVI
eukprot:4538476-Amphidinium_carterae.1